MRKQNFPDIVSLLTDIDTLKNGGRPSQSDQYVFPNPATKLDENRYPPYIQSIISQVIVDGGIKPYIENQKKIIKGYSENGKYDPMKVGLVQQAYIEVALALEASSRTH